MAKPSSSLLAAGGEAPRMALLFGCIWSWLPSRTEIRTGSCKLISASRVTPWRKSHKNKRAGGHLCGTAHIGTPPITQPGFLRNPRRLSPNASAHLTPGGEAGGRATESFSGLTTHLHHPFPNSDLWEAWNRGLHPTPRKGSTVKDVRKTPTKALPGRPSQRFPGLQPFSGPLLCEQTHKSPRGGRSVGCFPNFLSPESLFHGFSLELMC